MTPAVTPVTVPSGAPPAADGINLRRWFAGFILWLTGLAVIALSRVEAADGQSASGLAAWLLAIYAFYLSLCCVFFPLPTTWIVLFLASDAVAAQVGVLDHPVARLVVVASVGAVSTGLANLNEYHIFTFLLRYRGLARVKDTRTYHTAARWFAASPFLVIVIVSLVPIPVDVVRWLAIAARYPRWRFFAAYVLGRWLRYAAWCVTAMGLNLSPLTIVYVQVGLVLVAAVRVGIGLLRRRRSVGRLPAAAVPAMVESS